MFICASCSHNFSSKQCLEYHKTKNACKKKKHRCKYCNKFFSSSSTMYRHIRNVCKIKKEHDNDM